MRGERFPPSGQDHYYNIFLRRIETISGGGQTRLPRGIRHGKSRFTEAVGLPASVGLRVVDSISKPLRLYCDNKVAVFHANNNKSSGAAKHIEIKYFVVKDRIQDHTVRLVSVLGSTRHGSRGVSSIFPFHKCKRVPRSRTQRVY